MAGERPARPPWEPEPNEVSEFGELGRRLGVATVMFHATVGERLGLSATEQKCLDIAMREPQPLTAGRLAELSGLSTGAITGVLDRLERAGRVRRTRDPHDRRKVVVEVAEPDWAETRQVFEPMLDGLAKVLSTYTPEQLELIREFVARMTEFMHEQATRVRDLPPRSADD
jgi:DNA-binding MarR family transcriptional regulator